MTTPASVPSSFGPSRRAMVARDVQNARTLAYWLLSHERIGVCATAVDGLDSELLCIEGELDEPHGTISTCGLERELATVHACVRLADPIIAPQLRALITAGRAVLFALAPQRSSSGIRRAVRAPTEPIRPAAAPRSPAAIRRETLAHAAALAAGSTALFARTGRARGVGAALLASHAALAFLGRGTPPRRLAEWIWGAAAAILPLTLAYARRDALAAAVQAAAGAGVLAGSIAGTLASSKPAEQETRELLAVGL